METKLKSKIDEALAVDAHFSSYQIEFAPEEALEFARQAPAVGKVTPDRMVALIKRINATLPRTAKGRTFHNFRIGREETRFVSMPQTVAELNIERGRLLSVRLCEADLPREYRMNENFSVLTRRIMALGSDFRCSESATEYASDAGPELVEMKFFWK